MAKDFEDFIQDEHLIIKDPKAFDIESQPDVLVKRTETFHLFKEISRFVNYKTPSHIFLTGPPGTGKTVTIKYICEKEILKEKGIDTYYVNCRDKQAKQILKELIGLNSSLENKKIKSSEELTNFFLNGVNKPTLIVLDEMDKGIKIDNLLYSFSRTKELGGHSSPISLVIISNDISSDQAIDFATRSSLQLTRVNFEPYNVRELTDIMMARVKAGFHDSSSILKEDVKSIAERTVSERRSDCRVALKALFYAAQKAESKQKRIVEKECFRNTFMQAVRDVEQERIVRLNNNQLVILYACCVFEGHSFSEIYGKYVDLSESVGISSLKRTMAYYILDYLENQNLIKIASQTEKIDGHPRKKLVIKPLILEEVVGDELDGRHLMIISKK